MNHPSLISLGYSDGFSKTIFLIPLEFVVYYQLAHFAAKAHV
jgi:hypothetical protein